MRHNLPFSLILIAFLIGASESHGQAPAETYVLSLPIGLNQTPPIPEDNPLTEAKIRLGEKLFFDPILSGDGKISCASCHQRELNFATNDRVSEGVGGRKGNRNAPTLLNRAYGKHHFWDGRSGSLEDQALQPIENPNEMGSSIEEALTRLGSAAEYQEFFREAFPDADREASSELVTAEHTAKALASFMRTLLSGGSQVDRFRNKEYTALSQDARQGLWLFESKGGCWRCHSTDNFADEDFHNTGVGFGDPNRDLGRFLATGADADRFRYKTPTLRGVARTAPYMHDGSLATLEEVVEFYSQGGSPDDPGLSLHLKPLNLSDDEKRQLVAFLRALSE